MRWLAGHSKDVRAVAYTPDGRLVSAGSDKTVRVWDPSTGECITTSKAKGPVYAVAVSPDGGTLAYGGRHAPQTDSNFVHLCDLAGKPLGQLELYFEIAVPEQIPGTFEFRQVARPDPRSVWALAFSADGRYLAAACRAVGGGGILEGGSGHWWELPAGKGRAAGPLGAKAYAVTFAPAGARMAVTRFRVAEFHAAPDDPNPVSYPITAMWCPAVAFVPNQDLAVVASSQILHFVNPVRQEKVHKVKTGLRVVTGVAASPDGRTVLAGGKPGSVEVYDTAARTKTTAFDFGIGGVYGLAFAPDGLTFAVAGDKGLLVCDAPGE